MASRLGVALKNWRRRSAGRKIFDVLLVAFALAGFGITGAWAAYQLGFANNKGGVDENYRYLMSVSEIRDMKGKKLSKQQMDAAWMTQYARLAAFGKFYPENARLIMHAAQESNDPIIVDKMLAAVSLYASDSDDYVSFMKELEAVIAKQPQRNNPNVIPWMNTVEWEYLRQSILKDSALINEAGRLTGVEPRMIVGCLVGEQIRLFNTKREMVKKYLGPVKMLSVQSQFSYGVNGIKEHTAQMVEEHLKDTASVFYMGRQYENILDFETEDHETERYNRLVDYRNHLYSYIYTGCILHQTMLQWKRAGYDISDRPDILFTLFNVGFSQSVPKSNPVCGGSRIEVDGVTYTFGAIGFDFYYSGDLAQAFPFWPDRFVGDNGRRLSVGEIIRIQDNMSDCNRPEKGLEYRKPDSTAAAPKVEDDGFTSNDDEYAFGKSTDKL